MFSVKSFSDKLLSGEEVAFPHTSIWIPKVPPKVCFFTWLAARGAILTAENLRKRKINYVSWCFMCKSSGDNVDHLLIHCPVAMRLWWGVLCWFGITWVMPGTVKEVLFSWSFGKRRRRRTTWNVAPLALMWVLCPHINYVIKKNGVNGSSSACQRNNHCLIVGFFSKTIQRYIQEELKRDNQVSENIKHAAYMM